MGVARITIHTIPGLLAPGYIDVDVPLGPSPDGAGDLKSLFLRSNDQDDVADTVVELRDATTALATLTIPFYTGPPPVESAGPVSVLIEPGTPNIPAGADLFLRVTAAGAKAANLGGYYEVEGTGIAPVTGSRLTTLARVKQWGNIQGSDDDALLEALISAADSAIVRALDYPANPTPIAGEFYSRRAAPPWSSTAHLLYVQNPPLDPSTLVVRFDGTVQDAGDFAVDAPLPGQIAYVPNGDPTAWPCGIRNIDLDYTSGYLVLPEALVEAANRWTLIAYQKTGNQMRGLGRRSTTIGDDVITFAVEALGGMPQEVAELIAPFMYVYVVAS